MKDPVVPLLMVFILLLCCWLGIGGPIVEAAVQAQPSDWLGFLGGFLGGLCTLLAAYVAWQAVQPQLSELRIQSTQRAYEQFRLRATEIEGERNAITDIAAAREIMDEIVEDVRKQSSPIARFIIPANLAARFDFQHEAVAEAIKHLRDNYSTPWGTSEIQKTRRQFLNAAQSYYVSLSKLNRALNSMQPITPQLQTQLMPKSNDLSTEISRLATILHFAIEAEIERVGRRIAEMERVLV